MSEKSVYRTTNLLTVGSGKDGREREPECSGSVQCTHLLEELMWRVKCEVCVKCGECCGVLLVEQRTLQNITKILHGVNLSTACVYTVCVYTVFVYTVSVTPSRFTQFLCTKFVSSSNKEVSLCLTLNCK